MFHEWPTFLVLLAEQIVTKYASENRLDWQWGDPEFTASMMLLQFFDQRSRLSGKIERASVQQLLGAAMANGCMNVARAMIIAGAPVRIDHLELLLVFAV